MRAGGRPANWREWAIAMTVFAVLVFTGEAWLPDGDFRELAWPIIAGFAVLAANCLIVRAGRGPDRPD